MPHLPIKPYLCRNFTFKSVFVTHDSVANYDEYITVNLSDSNDVLNFRDDTKNNEIVNLSFECGFMYYYKKMMIQRILFAGRNSARIML